MENSLCCPEQCGLLAALPFLPVQTFLSGLQMKMASLFKTLRWEGRWALIQLSTLLPKKITKIPAASFPGPLSPHFHSSYMAERTQILDYFYFKTHVPSPTVTSWQADFTDYMPT